MKEEHKQAKLQSLIVTGDVTIDNYIYEGERDSSHKDNARGVKVVTELGGANNTYNILKELINGDDKKSWKVFPGFMDAEKKDALCLSSHSLWKPYLVREIQKDKDKIKETIWRMGNALGYGSEMCIKDFLKPPPSDDSEAKKATMPKILVLDDAGFQFRQKTQKNDWLLDNNFDWIILKLSRPLAFGDLWDVLVKNYSEKLIVIVSADELRAEDIKIARGSSWEQTVEDTRNALFVSHKISDLTKCKHLIISYNNDGALWLDNSNRNKPSAKLLCDTARAEGEWSENIQGKAFGYMTCLTAAVVYRLIDVPDIATGIEAGLSAMRNLLENGHISLGKNGSPSGFPVNRIAGEIKKPHHTLSKIDIPWLPPSGIKNAGKWMIAEMLQRSPLLKDEVSLHGLATQVVYYGTKILDSIPHAKFKKLTTTDRNEIETLRRLKQFMLEYRDDPNAKKPISFGVFGPPGAGKSFGVKQIANEVFREGSWLEFNLSQFTVGSLSELYGAFHQVRDKILSGITPVVFMDEFDSKKYEWLQYLLSPMQDREFQEGQLKHSVGKCIFIFAGATSYTFESFGSFKNDSEGREAQKDFVLKKGPDFKSRLDTYFNVLGPNQRILDPETNKLDSTDISYPLRRAIFITTKIKYESYLPAQIDLGLVNALLRAPKYIHGARSLDKLLSILQSSDSTKLYRSNLPANSQLAMYVDPIKFNKLLLEPQKTLQFLPIDELAPAIHESFRKLNKLKGWTVKSRFDKIYKTLDNEAKEDNIAAARRIQEILAIVNLRIGKANSSEKYNKKNDQTIESHLEHHIELLSTLEHNGWMMQRLKMGWKFNEKRDDDLKLHNLLIPYSKLPNDEKEKDRNSIRDYPKRLRLVGYRINWIK